MWLLLTEQFIMFVVLPALIYFETLHSYKFVFLSAGAVYCFIILFRDKTFKWNSIWNNFNPGYLTKILFRTIIISSTLFIFIFFTIRWELFHLPEKYRQILPLVVILYPLFSVFPQEFIYRTFFFQRYEKLIQNKKLLIFMSTFLFSFMHIIYNNPAAVIITFVGGYLFSKTYTDTGSLIITIIEHSIYGYLIFLFGLGKYFMNDNTFEILYGILL